MSEAEKRSVHTDALATLGTVISEKEHRDAIHIAVEPAQAAEDVWPGEDVGRYQSGRYGQKTEKKLGIVDPFLKDHVEAGQWFWLLVYPRQITSLRHVWAHAEFPDDLAASGKTEPEKAQDAGEKSEKWLRNFCETHNCPSYETTMGIITGTEKAAEGYPPHEYSAEYLQSNGYDAHCELPAEFWDHVESVLGHKVPYRPTYFSCSC